MKEKIHINIYSLSNPQINISINQKENKKISLDNKKKQNASVFYVYTIKKFKSCLALKQIQFKTYFREEKQKTFAFLRRFNLKLISSFI